jgi:hypothetical protein
MIRSLLDREGMGERAQAEIGLDRVKSRGVGSGRGTERRLELRTAEGQAFSLASKM